MPSVEEYCDSLGGTTGSWSNSSAGWDELTVTAAVCTSTDGTTAWGSVGPTLVNLDDIPSSATIVGIEFETYYSMDGDTDDYVKAELYHPGTSSYTSQKDVVPSASAAWRTVGGPTDLWGKTWTVADIQSSTFGARLTSVKVLKGGTWYLYCNRVRVYYTVSGVTCAQSITIVDRLEKSVKKRLPVHTLTVADRLKKLTRKKHRETSTFTASIPRRSFAKRMHDAVTFALDVVTTGGTMGNLLNQLVSETITFTDVVGRKMLAKVARETLDVTDTLRRSFDKRIMQALEVFDDVVPRFCICLNSYWGATSEGVNAWVNPENAEGLDADAVYATCTPDVLSTVSGIWDGYNIVGATEVIKQVQVLVTGYHSVKGVCDARLEISWDNGSTWGTLHSYSGCGTSPGDHYFDVTNDTVWTWAKLGQVAVRFGAYRFASPPLTAYVDRIVLVVRHGRLLRTEALEVVDSVAKTLHRVLYDASTFAESLTKTHDKVITESATLSDRIVKRTARSFSETMSFLDSIVKRARKSVSESLTVSDVLSIAEANFLTESLSETITFAISTAKSLRRSISDHLSVSGAMRKAFGKAVGESIAVTHAMSLRGSLWYRTARETLTIAHALGKSLRKRFTESFSPTDSLEKLMRSVHAESLGVADAMRRTAHKRLSEALTIVADISTSGTAYISKKLDEALTFVDSVTTRADYARRLDEALSMSDSVERIVQYVRTFSEQASIDDTVEALMTRVVALSESFDAVDAVVKGVGKRIRQTTTIVTSATVLGEGQLSRTVVETLDIVAESFRRLTRPVPADTLSFSDTCTLTFDAKRWASSVAGVASLGSNWNDGVVPAAGEDVEFGYYGVGNCDWDITTQVGDVLIDTGYAGTWHTSVIAKYQDFTQRDGTTTQGTHRYCYGDFRLEGGVYTPNASYSHEYHGNFDKTGGTYSTNAGQILMMTDGKTININDNVYCGILGIRGNTTVQSGVLRCITQFYVNGKTLTIDGASTRVMIYHAAIANITYTGAPVISSTNGGRLVIKLYDSKTLDADIAYYTLDTDLEFSRYTGTAADIRLTLANCAISLGASHDLYTTNDDSTYWLEIYNYWQKNFTHRNFTNGAKCYWINSAHSIYCYGNFDGGYSVQAKLFHSGTLHMYTGGTTITPAYGGYGGGLLRYIWLHHPVGTTITLTPTCTLVTYNGGTLTGDGGTFDLGNGTVFLYTYGNIPPLAGSGIITGTTSGSSGFYFILYASGTPGVFAYNVCQAGWTLNVDTYLSWERSVQDATLQATLSSDIISVKKLTVQGGYIGYNCKTKLNLNGYDIEGYNMYWNPTYSPYELIVDASVGSSEIRVVGTHFYVNGYVNTCKTTFIRGSSHVILSGVGNFQPARALAPTPRTDYYDITITGTYSVLNGPGYVYGDRLGVNFSKTAPGALITVRDYSEALTITDGGATAQPRFGYGKRIQEALSISHEIRKSSEKRVSESASFSGEMRKTMQLVKGDSFVLQDGISRAIGKRLLEALTVVDRHAKSLWRRFIEAITFVDTATPQPEITVEVGWLGSFPRPSVTAYLTLQISREATGGAVSDATVTASIFNPDTGALHSTVAMTEVISGIYQGTFSVRRTDPYGTYPVTIVATKGVLHPSTVSYEGYINVYVPMSTSISFR